MKINESVGKHKIHTVSRKLLNNYCSKPIEVQKLSPKMYESALGFQNEAKMSKLKGWEENILC